MQPKINCQTRKRKRDN